MLSKSALLALCAIDGVLAFPFVANAPGVNSPWKGVRSITSRRRSTSAQTVECAFNPSHEPAEPITSEYPYLGAKDGLPGTGIGGVLVPAKGDTAHEYREPGPLDVRGPCPGLNAMANHGFIARSGIVTYDELVNGQQNLYNVGYDLANVLAIAGVGLDGDLVGTGKLSIGCEDNKRTAGLSAPVAQELGLDGHNHFEADTSLSRDDFFLGNGDDYTWNATLFKMLMESCDGNCTVETLSKYRKNRWEQSVEENPEFFFGPGSLLLYGAASFLYELMPTAGGYATPEIIESFFGAKKTSTGDYEFTGGERIPPNWYNRVEPYSNMAVGNQIIEMYLLNPVLFGGNVDGVNSFDGISYGNGAVTNGTFNGKSAADAMCLIFQTLTAGFPSEIGEVVDIPVAVENAITSKLAPYLKNFGCPINYNA